jgi:2-oxoglutarate ferredoxin oxidoreductase subunit gamma
MSEQRDTKPSDEHRLICAGFGGQGVLSLGKLLCISAMAEGKVVTYLQSYGAEVRGGTANCQVIVSSDTIYSPLVESADSLIILNQLSYDRFATCVKPGGLMLLNSSTIDPGPSPGGPADPRVLSLPATDLAVRMGNVRVANVILLGAFLQLTGLVKWESCEQALEDLWGDRKADLVGLNRRALRRGGELATGQ